MSSYDCNKNLPDSGRGVILVTGGGRGIGSEVCKLAAHRGFDVAVNYSANKAAAEETVKTINEGGGRAVAVPGDVSSEADVVAIFDEVYRALGPLTVLVNNAGTTGGFSRVDAVQVEVLERVFKVNVIGAFLCAREAVRRLSVASGGSGGSIINVSSRASQYGGAGEWVHYAASKGAMDTFTLGLAREVGSEGIRVNAVAPGFITTELHEEAGAPDRAIRLAAETPMGRPGSAVEIAEVVMWLASPAAAYVTGTIVAAAGGR